MDRKLNHEQVEGYLRIIRRKLEVAKDAKTYGAIELSEYSIDSAEELLGRVERMLPCTSTTD